MILFSSLYTFTPVVISFSLVALRNNYMLMTPKFISPAQFSTQTKDLNSKLPT